MRSTFREQFCLNSHVVSSLITTWMLFGLFLSGPCCKGALKPQSVTLLHWIARRWYALCVVCAWATAEHTIRSGVLGSPGLLTSEDGSSHLDLQLSISCLCKRPNSQWSCDATFSAPLLLCRHNEIFFCLSFSPVSVSVYSLLSKPGEHNGLRRSAFEVLCGYLCASLSISPSLCFITFLKLKMYWFPPDVVISSRQKSISMSLATCCCCHCIFPLKSGLSFSINGSLIIEAVQVDKMHVLSCLPDKLSVARMPAM